ncbi:MAG: 23S rRNA (adenine(2503)-C(2))-methyltransferase RlmN [Bacteroidetes bacterium]|nr:23S rRNA (adenine(2503)-C(2))-methyltransferase RlmN [Bacteroidota bacterium]MBU1678546.1 23S rRNA (adenine(2503)-C(2))-methyltransferase RlmN [Bacteroidota bacterium]MBU2505890.1 23S rRNA (adenine(2503)-C(2))-methyltransferase RlmN [Bacteroidota bacterium]
MKIQDHKIELKGMTLEKLREYLESIGEKKFRGNQIFNWMYNNLAMEFDEMQNIPKPLRDKLQSETTLKTLELKTSKSSNNTGTVKYVFSTYDDRNIETVLIPDGERNTLCISTQVGCPLDCKFCATGLMGYKRNLSTGEIVDQYFLSAKANPKTSITNIVYMGMGEPLLNFERTLESLDIFTHELNKVVGRNRITVSTSGIPQRIIDLAESGYRVKMALSLHSCFEDIRSRIMPINNKYSLSDNLDALKQYVRISKTKITFEYTMLKGINDRKEDAEALAKICKDIPSKVNVIPFNSIAHMSPGGISAELEPTSKSGILDFVEELRNRNVRVMVRETQGDDIAAACGQLAVN